MTPPLLLAWGLGAAASAAEPPLGCHDTRSATDLQTETVQGAIAFAALDTEGFARSAAAAHETLRCLGEAVSPAAVVELHRTDAIEAFTLQDAERTRAAFQAVLATKPDWTFPDALGGEGHPLRKHFEEASKRPPSLMSPFDDALLTVYVNGRPSSERPANIPAVVQAATADGRVLWSGYIRAGMPLPDFAELAKEAGVVSPVPEGPDPAPEPPPTEAPKASERPTGLRFGFDLGMTTWVGGRVAYRRPEGGFLDGFGGRLILGTAIGDVDPHGFVAGVGFAPYLDLRLSKRWVLEPSLLVLGAGRAGAGVGVNAQWEYNRFHLHGGFMVANAGVTLTVPDFGVGWLF